MARKRPNGDGTYRQRKDGSWEYRFRLPSGRRKSLYAPTLEELKTKRAEAERKIAQGLDLSRPDITVREFMAYWLDNQAAGSVRLRTLEAYRQLASTHIYPAVGDYRLSRLTVEHVEKMMRDMVAAGLSPSTAQRARAVLRRCLKFALRDGLVARNVASLAEAPKSTAQPARPLTLSQLRHFLDTMRDQGHDLWPLFTLAACTGLRAGELYGLRWSDIDQNAATLRVERTVLNHSGGWSFGDCKTEKSRRTVPLIPEALEALRFQRKRQAATRLAASSWVDHGLIFTNGRGNPLNASNVNRLLHAALASCGLEPMGLHGFRHGCATMLHAAGTDMQTISKWLGHSTIVITANTYTHTSTDVLRGAADRFGQALKTG